MFTAEESLKYLRVIRNNVDYWERMYPLAFLGRYAPENSLDKKEIIKFVQAGLNYGFGDKGIYIHIPFCETRCKYCSLYSESGRNGQIMDNYIQSIEKEIKQYGINFKKIKFSNLYLGGGTPTLLSAKQLEKLFKIIFKYFSFKEDSQRNTEGTPRSLTRDKINVLEKFGFNRFTLGVESFEDAILKRYNRCSYLRDILASYQMLRESKIKNINIDMMLGLEGENKKIYKKYIYYLKKLEPDQVSFSIFQPGRVIGFKSKTDEAYAKVRRKEILLFPEIMEKMSSIGFRGIMREHIHDIFVNSRKANVKINLNAHNKWQSFDSVLGIGFNAISCLFSPQSEDNKLLLFSNKYMTRIPSGQIVKYNEQFKKNLFNKRAVIFNKSEVLRRHLIYNFYFSGKVKTDLLEKYFGKNFIIIFKNIFSPLIKDKMIKINSKEIILTDNYYKLSKRHNLTEREKYFIFILNYLYSDKILNEIKKLI